MSVATRLARASVSGNDLASAVVAAVLGSVAFGIVMSLTMGEVLLTAIPAMYGLEHVPRTTAIFVGWAIHVSHGTVLGLLFGAVVTIVPKWGARLRYGLAAGVGYGIVLWVALASLLMPVWVGAVTPMEPPVPDWRAWSLVGHVLYGAFLGALIPVYRRYP
jgi:hypothetical protein